MNVPRIRTHLLGELCERRHGERGKSKVRKEKLGATKTGMLFG
jgi:hypothetical protein